MIDAPAFFGPPISFLFGPWLLLVLLLIGPAALLITFVLAVAVAAAVAGGARRAHRVALPAGAPSARATPRVAAPIPLRAPSLQRRKSSVASGHASKHTSKGMT